MKTYCKLISRQRFHALEDRVPRACMYGAGDEWAEQESGFASLRDEPRFQAALEKQRQLRGEMRARVNVMLNEQ